MARAHKRFVATIAIIAIAGFSLAACSKSSKSKAVIPNATAPSQAAQGGGGAGASSAGGTGGGGGAASSAAAGGDTLLAIGPACQIVTAADIQAAVGMPLGNITGDISGGPQGATNYHSCIWTKDASGTGAAVNIAYGTYSSASAQLAKQKAADTDTANTLNSMAPSSQAIKDVSVGDGGYEVTTSVGDDTIWFTKGQQLAQVEVIKEVPGATLTIAQKVASKL